MAVNYCLFYGLFLYRIMFLLLVDFVFLDVTIFRRYILTIRKKPDYLPVDDQAMVLWDVVTGSKKNNFPWDSREAPSPTVLK